MSAVEPTVRAAGVDDLAAMAELLAALFAIEADFRPDRDRQLRGLAALLSAPDRAAVRVADAGGAVVGMVTGQLVISTAEGAPSCWVEDLVIAPAWRGRGVARALLAEVEAWARRAGATRLQLLADRENAPALACYGRLRWRRTRLVALRR
ncbi:N-acetyltransferase [Anaeromyxobacter sp. PSR-1]|uniref:GNAT family N-acetyltransferase n=1 Tax=unclassified Anaeromyxobacter TaxID=2620896 RepID=UPI0005E39D09|nr:GNAT family N-acetyltransferase [Anaeromyxobacter sp. PSR-1]GAO02065.1 aminoglycoside N(6')-acetyltransferase type 1 [Anaeromyxobacter sp. PSR-1]